MEIEKLREFHVDWIDNNEQSCDLRWMFKLKVKKIKELCNNIK